MFQLENWIDEIGEQFLKDHIDTGSSLEETEKYCSEYTTFQDEVWEGVEKYCSLVLVLGRRCC